MNLEHWQKTWSQQSVAGPGVDVTALRAELAREVRDRLRRVLRIIAVATFIIVVGWGVAIAVHFTGIKLFNRVTLATFIAGSLFDVGFLIMAVRARQRMHREAMTMGATLADALRASLRAVEGQAQDCIRFGYALGLVGLGSIAVALLHGFTGNLPLRGIIANIVVTALFVAGIAVTLRRYYRNELVVRREQLRREIAEWEK